MDDKRTSENPEEQNLIKPMESNNITQSASQIIEDIDDSVIFDAPQKKSVNKSAESNNCLKEEKKSKSEQQDVRKSAESNNTAQSASQIIEDEDTAVMDFNECVNDVSSIFFHFFFYLISYYIFLRTKSYM